MEDGSDGDTGDCVLRGVWEGVGGRERGSREGQQGGVAERGGVKGVSAPCCHRRPRFDRQRATAAGWQPGGKMGTRDGSAEHGVSIDVSALGVVSGLS